MENKKHNNNYLVVLFLILMIICFFPVKKVNAEAWMVLKCNYDSRCAGDRYCLDKADLFLKLTDNEGNDEWIMPGVLKNVEFNYKLEQDNRCWINSYENLNKECNEDISIGWTGKKNYFDFFNEGICPEGIRLDVKNLNAIDVFFGSSDTDELVPAGQSSPDQQHSSKITEGNYVVYKYLKKGLKKGEVNLEDDNNFIKVAEGYSDNGIYSVIGANLKTSLSDEIYSHQRNIYSNSVAKYNDNTYFNVDTKFYQRIISGNGGYADESLYKKVGFSLNSFTRKHISLIEDYMPTCTDENQCSTNYGYVELISSADTNGAVRKGVNDWYEKNNAKFLAYDDINELLKNKKLTTSVDNLIKTAENNSIYSFSDGMSKDNIIDNLQKGYNGLKKAYDNDDEFTDCATGKYTTALAEFTSCVIYEDYLGIKEIRDLVAKNKQDSEHLVNPNLLVEQIVKHVRKELNSQMNNSGYAIDILNPDRSLKHYTSAFYYAAVYLKRDAEKYSLTEAQKEILDTIITGFEELVDTKGLDIYPVVDCESLIGEDLKNKLNSYMNIFKIAVPLILIAFGIIDFTKAIFASDDSAMKKAQTTFIKRLAIALILFLTPTVVNILFTIANKAWSFISPGTCGIN